MNDDLGCGSIEQAALAELMQSGAFDRHLRHAATELRHRRTALLEGLRAHCRRHVKVNDSGAGMHVVGWLPDWTSNQLEALTAHARGRGLGLHPIGPHYRLPACAAGPAARLRRAVRRSSCARQPRCWGNASARLPIERPRLDRRPAPPVQGMSSGLALRRLGTGDRRPLSTGSHVRRWGKLSDGPYLSPTDRATAFDGGFNRSTRNGMAEYLSRRLVASSVFLGSLVQVSRDRLGVIDETRRSRRL